MTAVAAVEAAIADLEGACGTRVLCNACGQWGREPYRRGRCTRCTGVKVGAVTVCCGDCDRYPCECPRVDDADMAWLGREGGAPADVPAPLRVVA
jgi:hypothetical protein